MGHVGLAPSIRRLVTAPRRGADSYTALGRRYEESCQTMLRTIGISSRLVGGASDGGVDLVGEWHLQPSISIIAQCKNISRACPPAFVRELEGTLSKSPKGTTALLIASTAASRASVEAMMESTAPLLYLYWDMVRLKSAFMNAALQSRLPQLCIGVRHVAGDVEPAFFIADHEIDRI